MMKLTQWKKLISAEMINEANILTAKQKLYSLPDSFSVINQYLGGQCPPRAILWHVLNDISSIPLCQCGNQLAWHADKREYRKFCSKSCTGKFTIDQRKQNHLAKTGAEWHSQLPKFKEQIAETSLQKWGVTHYSKTNEHTQRMQNANLKNFGVAYPSQLGSVRQQTKEQWVKSHGVTNPMHLQVNKDKVQATCQIRYGSDSWAQQHYTDSAKHFLSNTAFFIKECECHSASALSEKYSISVSPIYAKARECNVQFPSFTLSHFEKTIIDYITSNYSGIIQTSVRNLIAPHEVDIYLPDLQIAIECNGTYWHSELGGKRLRNYHVNKTEQLNQLGIQLIHIWEHQFTKMPSIILSKLNSLIGRTSRIAARKCSVEPIESSEAKLFLNENHIQGQAPSTIKLGLRYNNELVALMCIANARYTDKYDWELIRYCTKLNSTVVGGASRLLHHSSSLLGKNTTLISYASRDHSIGNLYKSLGFNFLHNSAPNYWYTKNYVDVYSRQKYQKHKLGSQLNKFDPNLTEWDNMQFNGWDRYWDCGQIAYVKEIQ